MTNMPNASYTPELGISAADKKAASKKFWGSRKQNNELDIEAFHQAFDDDFAKDGGLFSRTSFLPDGLFNMAAPSVISLFENKQILNDTLSRLDTSAATKGAYYGLLAAISIYGAQKWLQGNHRSTTKPPYTFTNLYNMAANQTTASQATTTQQVNKTTVDPDIVAKLDWPAHITPDQVVELCSKVRVNNAALKNTTDGKAVLDRLKRLWVAAVRQVCIKAATGITSSKSFTAETFLEQLPWRYTNNGTSLSILDFVPFNSCKDMWVVLWSNIITEIKAGNLETVVYQNLVI